MLEVRCNFVERKEGKGGDGCIHPTHKRFSSVRTSGGSVTSEERNRSRTAQSMENAKRTPRREGEKVWCPDPRNVWQLGTVVEDDGEKLHVLLPEGDNNEQQFTVAQVHQYDPTHSMDLENISEMDNLHQAPLLDLLRRRYLDDKIYVSAKIATVLAHLNLSLAIVCQQQTDMNVVDGS